MVAGGVQSVEEGTLYATHPSYYPQFYSTLLPPAPPGSYSSSNYSSSTYSSSGQSSDCSWLRPEGVEGAFVPSPSGRGRHPRCTCPSPEALRQARKALIARRVRASRDPRCTCPSPPGSRDVSPWSGTSPSPPSTPATASPPPRHPRCTCPDSDPSHKLSSNRLTRSARDLRCTCPSSSTPPTPSREAECTCPPHSKAHQTHHPPHQHQPTRRSSKGRLVHAVLLNYPGSTAISTDHGDFVKLSDSPGKISEPDVVVKTKPKKSKGKVILKEEKTEDEDVTSGASAEPGDVGCAGGSDDTLTPPSSPAQRVKNKLCHLRHKVVSGVASLAISRGQKDQHDAHGCKCEAAQQRPRVRAPGMVTRILPPPPSPVADESSQDEEKNKIDSSISSDQDSTFPMEDLPRPILEDVCSPLGVVPPLSPPKHPFTPTIRENIFQHPLTRHIFELGSNANLTTNVNQARDNTTLSFSRTNELRVVNPNLKQLQKLSISHGQLDDELASVIRTRSMELFVKDITDQPTKLAKQKQFGGSVSHIAAVALPATSHKEDSHYARKVLHPSTNRLRVGNGGLQFSTPCLSSSTLTCFSTSQNTLKVEDIGSVDRSQGRLKKHPDYENVAFHNSGEYVMLSKKLLDQWHLSYDACLPPEGSQVVTDSEGVTTLKNDLPSVNVSENGQVSCGMPLQQRHTFEKVALTPCPSATVPLPFYSSSSHISGDQTHLTVLPPPYITTIPHGSVSTSTTNMLHSSIPLQPTFYAYDQPISIYPTSSPTPPPSTPPLTTFTVPSTLPLPSPPSSATLAQFATHPFGGSMGRNKTFSGSPRRTREEILNQISHHATIRRDSLKVVKKEDLWMPRNSIQSEARSLRRRRASDTSTAFRRGSSSSTSQLDQTDDGDTDQETDRLLGQQRSDDPGFYDEKIGGLLHVDPSELSALEKEKESNKKKGRSKEVLIEGVLFRARYLGSTQLVSEGQPTKTTRMMQAEEAVSRIKAADDDDDKEALTESHDPVPSPGPPYSPSPQDSPIAQMSPGGIIVTDPNSLKECDITRIPPREQICPQISDSPRSKTNRCMSSPRNPEQFHSSPSNIDSPQRAHKYPQSPPEIRHTSNTTAWKPIPKMSTNIPTCTTCSYMTNVNSSHTIVPPLPPGVLEEPIETESTALLSLSEKGDPISITVGEEDYELEDDEEDIDDNEVEEDEEVDEEVDEEEDEPRETDKLHVQKGSIRLNDFTKHTDEILSSDSEDQCIEVLTVIPGASGTTMLQESGGRLEVDGDGEGSLEWVSEESGGPGLGPAGTVFHLRLVGSVDVAEESGKTPARKNTAGKRPKKDMVMEAVAHLKALAPDGETQPSTEVDLFISTEKIMVLNTDLKEIMMDHALRTISYIADIGDLVVLMARRRVLPTDDTGNIQKTPKMICHVFESDEAQFIAQSIGQAFQVAYLEFLKANGIEDHSFVKEMDYQEVLNSQEIFGDELQMFAKKELQKEVVVPKMKSEILGVVVVESGWGSMVPTVVIANLSPTGAAAKCGQLNIGDQIIAINGVSLVGLPLSTCQNYIKNTKYNTAVKLTVVPCPPVVEVKIRRPDTKYQLGFSVQNGVICSLLRGGIAERGGVRVGHRIIDINSQSVVAVPHEKIVNLLATSVGEIRMKTMPTSIFRLLTGQETPQYI